MTLENAIRTRILELCHEQSITLHALAHRCGIASSTMQNIFYRESTTPCVSTIVKICDGLGISLADFFVNDLFRNLDEN